MSDPAASEVSQYLTFILDGDLYALDIRGVREVLQFTGATKVPRTPEFMRGVINLRGHVVPVIDLRLTLGLPAIIAGATTCVIIIEVDFQGEPIVLGALVDAVHDVTDLGAGQIAPPPRMGTRIDAECIRGIGRRDDRFLVILDINRVLGADSLGDGVVGEVGGDESSRSIGPA